MLRAITRAMPGRILHHHLSPFRLKDGRQFRPWRCAVLIVVPAALAVWITYKLGPLPDASYGNFLTVFSVIAAVLTALLAVVQNAVGALDAKTKFTEGQRISHKRQVTRLEVLRELYASIAFSVIVLVLSMAPIVLLQIVTWLPPAVRTVLSGVVYLAGAIVAVGSFHIVFGVYRVLDVQADQIAEALRNNSPDVAQVRPQDRPTE